MMLLPDELIPSLYHISEKDRDAQHMGRHDARHPMTFLKVSSILPSILV